MTIKLFAYTPNSNSAKLLAEGLNIKRLRHEGSKWTPKLTEDIVINWGHVGSKLDNINCLIFNKPTATRTASNKQLFLEAVTRFNEANPQNQVCIPPYTTSTEEAKQWVQTGEVVCRKVLNGHSGEGIVVATSPDEIIDAPLYTKYIPKKAEFRLHVMGGEVFDIARKIRDPSKTPTSYRIRNYDAGFIFARNELEVPPQVIEQALLAVRSIGLDFGAVDIIYNKKHDKAYVLEINTAPGLQGASVDNYVTAFKKALGV